MLKKQLYNIFIVSLLIPILAIGSILLYNNYNLLFKHHKDMIVSDNLRVRSVMFEVTTFITNLSDAISKDVSLYNLISTDYDSLKDSTAALDDFNLLQNTHRMYTQIASITLYTDNPTLSDYDYIKVLSDDNRAWFTNMINLPGYHWFTANVTNRYGIQHQQLQLVRPISLFNSNWDAVLVIAISNNYLKNLIDTNSLEVDITVNHDPIFYSSWGNANTIIDYKDYYQDDFFRYSGISTFLDRKTLLEASAINPIKTDDTIYIFSNDPSALPAIRRIILVNLLIVMISIIIPFIIIVKYTIQLTNRVNTLKTEMSRVTSGDYNITEHFTGHDELADLFKSLQEMIHSIKTRDQLIFDNEIKKQKLVNYQQKIELQLLSSKINPHFLFNTLETFRMKAVSSKNFEVAESIKLLGQYMRYNLESTGSLTTLAKEIYYINVYLKIQNMRFYNRISYRIHIDDSLDPHKIQILPLLIQPIVENSFIHGHQDTVADGIIEVNILDKEKNVLIQVRDNGCGLEREKLLVLKEKVHSQGDTNYTGSGLYNIHHRLQLFYGKRVGLEIIAQERKGMLVQFEIPKLVNELKE